jgi:hypothetical protein
VVFPEGPARPRLPSKQSKERHPIFKLSGNNSLISGPIHGRMQLVCSLQFHAVLAISFRKTRW